MNRLTKKIDENHICFTICENKCPDGIYEGNPACVCTAAKEALIKLMHYEDLEESLEKTYGKCDGLLEMTVKYLAEHEGAMSENPKKSILLTDADAEKWQRWKELEATGKLIDLPCKPGDTVYLLAKDLPKPQVIPHKVKNLIYCVEIIPKIGKTVFLTEQEANDALEGMKNESGAD